MVDLDVGLCVGEDSVYFKDVWSHDQADQLVAALRRELWYVDRTSMVFRIFGRTVELPRDKQFFGDPVDGGYYLYRYGGDHYPVVHPWIDSVRSIRDQLASIQYCNHAVVNRYLTGADHIGLHHDKVGDWNAGACVVTASFGGTRQFRMKHQESGETIEFHVEHGSVFVLGAADNQAYKLSVVKTARDVEERISLTFRSIATVWDLNEGKVRGE
jgi:alkylated DNA repair dioxygenase AlkB